MTHTRSFVPPILLAVAAMLLVAGCGSVPPLQHVTLTPPQTQDVAARPSNWTIQRVQMPDYLDSYNIQLRSQDYVLTQLPDAKWAERLPAAVTRLLQQTIDKKLKARRDKHYQVHVAIDTFEPQPAGGVVLAARWRVTGASGQVVAHDHTLIREPLPATQHNADAIGQAMSAAVQKLAMQIVGQAG